MDQLVSKSSYACTKKVDGNVILFSELVSVPVVAFDGAVPSVGNGMYSQRAGENAVDGQSAHVTYIVIDPYGPFATGWVHNSI